MLDKALWAELYPPAAALSAAAADLILSGIEQSITRYVGYSFATATVTEYLSPSGEDVVTVTRGPVTAWVNVWEDWSGWFGQPADSFDATASLLTLGTDYAAEMVDGRYTGRLLRIGSRWPVARSRYVGRLAPHQTPAYGSVKVTYTAGYDDGAPADVAAAAYREASMVHRNSAGGMVASETVDGYGLTLQEPAKVVDGATAPFLTAGLLAVCRMYRKVPIA